MAQRLSRWKVAERLGKRRATSLEPWIEWGLLPQPDEAGTWDPRVGERVRHAMQLEHEARRLSRRALLLHRDGYRVDRSIRKRAVVDVLERLARRRHRVGQGL